MQYPMVHPITFAQNPLINFLNKDPYWTVSDDKKRPVNARLLLDTGNVYNARFDEEWPLTSLSELDADQNLQAVNRAYRLRARENRVIAIDVEPHAPENIKQFALAFPAHYTELSKNGGVHLLIQVPDDLINPENRYMFDDLSVFKEPVAKPENPDEKPRSAYFEVIFNDHFVTFTKKMITQKPCVNYNQDTVAKEKLAGFLDNIVQLDKQKKHEREIAKQYRLGMMDGLVDDDKEALIEEFVTMTPFEKAIEQAESKSLSDFGGDASRYEMSIANGLAFQVIRIHKLAKETISFKDLAESLTEQDLAYAVFLLLSDTVPYRGKHDETREDLPWLLYTSKRAYEYVKAKNANKKKE